MLLHRSPVNAVSTIVFNLLVRFNVCHKPVRTYDVGAPSAITISLPGMDPADAERRRLESLENNNYFYSGTCEIAMGSSNAGAKSGKGLPVHTPPPPYEKSRKRLPAHPFPLTSEVVAIEPKDPLGQLVIGSNVCTVTREILVCLWMWSSTLLYSIYNTTDNLL